MEQLELFPELWQEELWPEYDESCHYPGELHDALTKLWCLKNVKYFESYRVYLMYYDLVHLSFGYAVL